MTSHKDHDHANTPAARAACRKGTAAPAQAAIAHRVWAKFNETTETHCELCGTTDVEEIEEGDQGYTRCCNEPRCYGDTRTEWTWGRPSVPVYEHDTDTILRWTESETMGTIATCCSARVECSEGLGLITHV